LHLTGQVNVLAAWRALFAPLREMAL